MVTIIFILFFVLMLLGVPIAMSLALGATGALIIGTNIPLVVVAQKFYNGIDSFAYLAIPLFLMAGNIMAEAKISDKLVALASLMVGKHRGGLAHVATGSSAFFGAISGSAPATTSAIGAIMIPSMEKRGYPKAYSAAVVAVSGILGLIIPPSLTMVVYGVTASVSIGDLFLCGFVPGIIITLALMGLNYLIARKQGFGLEERVITEKKDAFKIIKDSLVALLMPVIILGGIYSGIFTATESAAIACLYGIVIGLFFYRTLTLKSLFNILRNSAESTALILFLMGAASLFSFIIAREEVPQKLAQSVLGITTNQTVIMLIMLVGFMIIGTFLDNIGAMVLIVPTLSGVVQQANIDPLYFGVFMVIALAVGQVTPPVGLNLFIASNIAKVKFEKVVVYTLPYILLCFALLILFIFVPDLLTAIYWFR